MTRERLDWPEVSEIDVIRHYTRVSQKNHAIDIDMYPLGSCTMKYNPKINEAVARYCRASPISTPTRTRAPSRARCELMCELQEMLAEISGFAEVALAAGRRRAWRVDRLPDHPRLASDHEAIPPAPRSWSRIALTAPTRPPRSWPVSTSSLFRPMLAATVDLEALRAAVGPDTAGADDHQPEHARALGRAHRGDRGRRPRGGWSRLQRRRQLQCHPRHRPARRPRHRHHALQPAQDLFHAARRRRSRVGSGRRTRRIWRSFCLGPRVQTRRGR